MYAVSDSASHNNCGEVRLKADGDNVRTLNTLPTAHQQAGRGTLMNAEAKTDFNFSVCTGDTCKDGQSCPCMGADIDNTHTVSVGTQSASRHGHLTHATNWTRG
jgi:hypothetical protein